VKELPPGSGIGYGATYRTSGSERVAVLPVGYSDGLSRALSNNGEVLIRGRRAPIRGRVCMNQVIVSLEGFPPVAAGEEAVLIGRQGADAIGAAEVAARIGTISYEVLCAVSGSVPRYFGGL